jgi:hypothetical protein
METVVKPPVVAVRDVVVAGNIFCESRGADNRAKSLFAISH